MSEYVMQCPCCGHWRGFISILPVSPRTMFHCFYCNYVSPVFAGYDQVLVKHRAVNDESIPVMVQELNKQVLEGGPSF